MSLPRAPNHMQRAVGSNNNISRMKWLKSCVRECHNSRLFVGFSLCASTGFFETELGHGSVGGVEFAV